MKKNYTQLPNEILEILAKTKFRNYEIRYIFCLLRKTLGFHKESDRISNSQFVQATSIKKWHISKIQKELIRRKVVAKRGNKLSFNFNYGEWKLLPKRTTVAQRGGLLPCGVEKLPCSMDTKEINKRNYTKERPTLSSKELSSSYKEGNKDYKPFFWGQEMRWSQGQWWVLPKDGGEWLRFNTTEDEIEWQKL